MDRPCSMKKRRMCLIQWTTSLNPSMSGCTSVRNEQRTTWRSARPGLRETGQLMAAQFHWGTLASPLTEYLIRSITRYTLSTPAAEDRPKLGHNKGSQVAWCKRFIKFDHQLSSNDEDDCESSPNHDDHSPSPNRDHSPPHPLPSSREDRGLLLFLLV